MEHISTNKKVTVLIPCYNEEEGIGGVIKSFPVEKLRAQNLDLEIVVIDNNSTDRTAEIARALGVKVIHQPKKGKGNAIRLGFNAISEDTDYVVMLDGDNTYRPEEVLRLLKLLETNFCDVVIGSRLGGHISDGSMTFLNKVGNWIFSNMVRLCYRTNVTDVLTGYFAWRRDALVRLRPYLVSEGFTIEMEMVTKMAKLGEKICSVPISYDSRKGTSNLRPFRDGLRILWVFIKNLFWHPHVEIDGSLIAGSSSVVSHGSTLSIVIPALNEEHGIRATIEQIPVKELEEMGYRVEILVVDNASTDNTAQISRDAGARVVYQPLRGYGNAYRAGFAHATGDIIATGDADRTYPLDALPELLKKMNEGGFDFLNTDRLSTLNSEAMTFSHVFGNWFLTTVTKILFNWPFNDSQSGMWVFKRPIVKYLDLESEGMPFSQELKIEAYKKGFKCGEVPIEYRARLGKAKLSMIKDGFGNLFQLCKKRLVLRKARFNSSAAGIARLTHDQ